MCLFFLSLLLTLRPTQAQSSSNGWGAYQCAGPGNSSSSPFYTVKEDATTTYPADMISAAYANPDSYEQYLFAATPVLTQSPYTLSGTYYGDTFGVDLPASSAAAGNCIYNGSGDSGTYYVTDASGHQSSGPINGSQTVHMDGKIIAYFQASWQGLGPQPAYPDHLDFLVSTYLSASASASYGSSGLTGGLSATAKATDGDPFNETASASAGDGSSGGGTPTAGGKHLVRAAVDPGTGIAEVYLNATTDWTASNSVPYMVPAANANSQPQVNGATSASASSYVSMGTQPDSREVGISCPDMDSPFTTNIISANLANNYYKGPYDTQHGTDRYQHARLLSGNSVDSVVFVENVPFQGQQFIAGHTYNSGAAGFIQPTYTWTISGDGAPDANTAASLGPSITNPRGIPSLPANLIFGSTWDPTKTKSSQFSVSVKDTNSAVGGDTYSVTWHAQQESFIVLSSQHDVPHLVGTLQSISLNESIPAYVTIPGQEGEIDWGSVQQQSGLPVAVVGAGAGGLLLIPEIAAGPYGWAAVALQAVAAGASYKLGTSSPTHPGTVQLQGNASYAEYYQDLIHQIAINNDPNAANNLPRFRPASLASQAYAASTGNPADWNSDPYFRGCTAMWQGGWYVDEKYLQGDGYNVNGYSGHVPGHTEVATAPFKYFLWTCTYIKPPTN